MKKSIVIAMILILLGGAAAGVTVYFTTHKTTKARTDATLGHFASAQEFVEAFKNGRLRYSIAGGMMKDAVPAVLSSEEAGAPEHSTTNVQVEGVDEADIVKNDGNYIYVISGRTLFIVAAYPARDSEIVSRIDFEKDATLNEMFVKGDMLIVIGQDASRVEPAPDSKSLSPQGGVTFAEVYDISEREKPSCVRAIEYEGDYSTARMIEDDVHIVLTTSLFYAFDLKDIEPEDIIPKFRDGSERDSTEEFAPACDFRQVEVADPRGFTSLLSIVSFSADGADSSLNKRVLAGHSDTVYASLDNIYVASAEWPVYAGLRMPEPGDEAKTTVYKFALDGQSSEYVTSGQVPGTILNQFSMDESEGFFRIATTLGHLSREGSNISNNVYILDPEMKIAGSLEGLAPGESIYSARFMGERAYLVTFKKVDPLFVLDLSNPREPRVLGELKIPGYSDYLHPYDETHIIGVGLNTVEAAPEEGGDFAWYQGMKIAIFDVTDVTNPVEMHKVVIGDRGTDSYALYDHKAFLFDRDNNLMVLPVLLAELSPEQKASPDTRDYDYGAYTFQGAYVYDVSLAGGFYLKGRITHAEDPIDPDFGYSYYDAPDSVSRSLYIGDNLYTVSEARIKINRLGDLGEVATVELE